MDLSFLAKVAWENEGREGGYVARAWIGDQEYRSAASMTQLYAVQSLTRWIRDCLLMDGQHFEVGLPLDTDKLRKITYG
jgi:hypothetical protein